MREGFDEALDLYIRTGTPLEFYEFDRKHQMLACEIRNQLGDKLLLVVQPYDKRDGALLLRTLSMTITQILVDKIAVLRERFSNLQSCSSKEGPALALRQWKEDLDELQASG